MCNAVLREHGVDRRVCGRETMRGCIGLTATSLAFNLTRVEEGVFDVFGFGGRGEEAEDKDPEGECAGELHGWGWLFGSESEVVDMRIEMFWSCLAGRDGDVGLM
jgi:hypothetical protein